MTARTVLSWICTNPDCDEYGTGPESDRDAERHTTRSGHATTTHLRAEEPK